MNLRTILTAAAVSAGLSLTAGQALALDNGSFETLDFSEWVLDGPGFITGEANSSLGNTYYATDGDVFARLNSGLGEGVYTTLSHSFTLLGAGSVSGSAAFLSFDYLPYDDDAFVRIFDQLTSQTLFSASIGSVGDYGETGWTQFSANLGPGSYTLQAAVRNNVDNGVDSALLLDNVSIQGSVGVVPEPGAWALMILGFGGAGAALRRRRMVLA